MSSRRAHTSNCSRQPSGRACVGGQGPIAARRLAFGPEENHVSHLGYYAATWPLSNEPGLEKGSIG
ncbi:hypothetical protein ACH4ND_27735 [Streptomyces sp. NPDC017179]|uniref:hypothetical protein n=1 Tax=Streptomyces sp. NPDC017179 TaxID=3364979 RepID=UPI0037B81228